MDKTQLMSRRPGAAVDFRPDTDPESPFAQLRRLSAHMEKEIPPAEEITDCQDALDYLREYSYRKLFTGTSHEEFVQLDSEHPEVVDWLLAIHAIESSNFTPNRRRP